MEIRKMQNSDLENVLLVTVQAFQNTPLYEYVVPDESTRIEFLKTLFRFRIMNDMGRSEIDLAISDNKIVGAAIWNNPIKQISIQENKNTSTDALAAFSPEIRTRWGYFYKVLVARREKSIQQPFWSLSPIVVMPKAQGKGIASKLIRKKLFELDAEKMPCFLATQDIKNRNIYNRYGFVTMQEDVIDNSNLISYTMVRPKVN